MIDFLEELKRDAKTYDVYQYVKPVLEDPRFAIWSGAGKDIHHHYGDGGLLKHTYEVYQFSYAATQTFHSFTDECVNVAELLVSAIWHDYGKVWDYQKIDDVWGKYDNHARQIHHISRSALEFEKHYCNPDGFEWTGVTINKDNVIHNILSHHGMREWGSPVSPATKEAWILHLSDNMSARLDDCDKHDRIK